MELDACYKKGLIKKTTINSSLIASLIEMAAIKEETVRNAQLNERNISAYVSLAYDALRELLEALCIQSGYKVLSHDCIGEFLRESIKDFDYVTFDRVRYIRNGINYYGVRVGFGQGKEIIHKIFTLKKKMEGYLEK